MHSNCARLLEPRDRAAGEPAAGGGGLRASVVTARRDARDPPNWRVNPRCPAIASQKPPTRHGAKANRNATQTDAIHSPPSANCPRSPAVQPAPANWLAAHSQPHVLLST